MPDKRLTVGMFGAMKYENLTKHGLRQNSGVNDEIHMVGILTLDVSMYFDGRYSGRAVTLDG